MSSDRFQPVRPLPLALLPALVLHGPVIAQETSPQDFADGGIEEIVVEGRLRASATDAVTERLEQAVPVDILGVEQISRVGDSSVSGALRRLPGVTLVADQFIYIRGLGERYSSTTLNSARVPSPDLTRNVIPLDLFPAEILDSLVIQKGYSPELPASFGGGNVDIRTRSIPDGRLFVLELGTGWNSESSGRGLSYPGGDDDWLGTDDGTRALPGELAAALREYRGDISPGSILAGLRRDGGDPAFADAQAVNRALATSLNGDIDFRNESLDPDISVEGGAGNSWHFGGGDEWRAGVLGIFDYGNTWRNKDRVNRSVLAPEADFTSTRRTVNEVSLTGSLTAGLAWNDEHRVDVTGLFIRSTEDESSLATGHNFNYRRQDGDQVRSYAIRYEERELETLQLRGSHTLGPATLDLLDFLPAGLAEGAVFSWYWSDSTATTAIPNEVRVAAADKVDPATGELLSTAVRMSGTAAEYRFTDLDDDVRSYGWDLSVPWSRGDLALTLTGGLDIYDKGRRYIQTQFGLGTTEQSAAGVLAGTPGAVFTDANLLDPGNGFVLSVGGVGTESYLAAEKVDAWYGLADLTWSDTWRVVAGARWEDFKQVSVPVDPLQYGVDSPKVLVPIDSDLGTVEDEFYPSLAVTWMRPGFWAETFQLRLGWSRTVARPDLREITRATYIDPLTEARVVGNPDLVTSDISSYDLRAEWYFDDGDNLTASVFYKDIADPIETVEGSATGDDNVALTFVNADSARVYGLELEGLKSLRFLAPALGDWTDALFVSGNLTLSDSEIDMGRSALGLTNSKRRMSQHSEYVANLQLGYDSPGGAHSASLVYNLFGERLYFAGKNGARDAFEQPFHSLDVVYTWYPSDILSLKLRLQNLLDDNVDIEQAGVQILEQEVGRTVKADVALRF